MPSSREVGGDDSSLGKSKQLALSARRLHTARCCSPTWLRATRPPMCHLLASWAKWCRISRLVKYRTAPGGRYWYSVASFFLSVVLVYLIKPVLYTRYRFRRGSCIGRSVLERGMSNFKLLVGPKRTLRAVSMWVYCCSLSAHSE